MGQQTSKDIPWEKPKLNVREERNGVTVWNTLNLNLTPEKYGAYQEVNTNLDVKKARSDIEAASNDGKSEMAKKLNDEYDLYLRFLTQQDEAKKLHRLEGTDWLWTCRIYVRSPDSDRGQKPDSKYRTTWGMATAFWVQDAQMPNSNSVWLLTAAHNVAVILPYACTGDGTIINSQEKCMGHADAIYAVIGWGETARCGWVDKVAAMSDFLADTKATPKLQKFDGAVLHLTFQPDEPLLKQSFRNLAPSLGWLITHKNPKPGFDLSAALMVPGFPGEINEFKDLAGLYVSGIHSGPGFTYKDFGIVELSINASEKSYDGSLVWDQQKCYTAEGQSGAPCVILLNGQATVVAIHYTAGVGAPFVMTPNGERPVAVDPWALLRALGWLPKGK